MRRPRLYTAARRFFVTNGPGPYRCMYCGGKVLAWWATGAPPEQSKKHLAIVHLDRNDENVRPENLAPAHLGCARKH